ncbi:thioredoxin-like protein [Spirosoma oryzae]|uniref:Thioredoxin-like protein n=1 Tax=Spirosoma oryzae TaxID=1469603 RepID=A0A2T0TBL3_9BACT|nr:thioredoxin family protein [Spirosoma oryzae]PRY43056.1 thioredoxin-like protein [Spirosoma oryzae]
MNRFLLLFCLLTGANAWAQQPGGIHFFSGSWQQVLAEARRQHKPIFLDVYAHWCPPCQRMAREALPNSLVGAAYNDRFINYQLDAETGEGATLARQYGIASYPTALFLTPDGQVVHRGVGYGGINGMVQQADLVLRMSPMRRALRKRPAPLPDDTLRTLR